MVKFSNFSTRFSIKIFTIFHHFSPFFTMNTSPVRQNDIEKIMAYQKIFIGPLVWKCSTNDFELLLSENLSLKIFPGEVRVRQNDIEKIIAYQKCFIGPLVWKCFTNNFELLLSEKEFPTFCTFFMYINVHGHQIFAKCTLNECTKMELDPPLLVTSLQCI